MSGFTSVGLNRRSVRYRRKLPSALTPFSSLPFFSLSPLSEQSSVARRFRVTRPRPERDFRFRDAAKVAAARLDRSKSASECEFEFGGMKRRRDCRPRSAAAQAARRRFANPGSTRHPRGDVADGNEQPLSSVVFHLYTPP